MLSVETKTKRLDNGTYFELRSEREGISNRFLTLGKTFDLENLKRAEVRFGGAVIGALLLKYRLALPLLFSGVCMMAVALIYVVLSPSAKSEQP